MFDFGQQLSAGGVCESGGEGGCVESWKMIREKRVS